MARRGMSGSQAHDVDREVLTPDSRQTDHGDCSITMRSPSLQQGMVACERPARSFPGEKAAQFAVCAGYHHCRPNGFVQLDDANKPVLCLESSAKRRNSVAPVSPGAIQVYIQKRARTRGEGLWAAVRCT